ncbi:MAG: Beta-lactamase class [Acidimicrobiaceae bacterium]|nr:Beta-lactamase class [Acidimicrobiaceae bacterium]
MRALDAVEHWGAGDVAVAVLDRNGVIDARGPLAEVRPLASVTKLLCAMAVLVASEEGALTIDDEAGPPGSTLRHLLSHASGCSLDDPGRILAAPGKRRIYSNAGIELAAAHLESCTGLAFADYLGSGVLEPLGARSCTVEGSPAKDGRASLEDLVPLAAELLGPRLLAASTLESARRVAFPGLAGVVPGFGRQDPCDWGLGFEIAGHKSPHWTGRWRSPETFGHFGQSGSFLWVDPQAGVACAALCEVPFGDWAKAAWPAFADAILSELGLGDPGLPATGG